MAKLSMFTSDTRAINDGTWIRVNEALYGDLDILTRGHTDEFIDAQNARLRQAAQPYNNDPDRVPNAVRRDLNASLLRDYLVLDVRNLVDDDDAPVSKDQFIAMLDQPDYSKLARACWDAAARVTALSKEQLDAAKGNSAKPSTPS
jgi:hypothetical protein